MNPFVQHETHDEEIVDPRDGEKWTVTMRVLNAGDDAALRDETVIETDEVTGVDRSRVPMGRLRMIAVQRAVVSWTLPLPPSAEAIAVLHQDVFEQIYKKVRFAEGKQDPVPPTGAPTDASSLDAKDGADS